MNGTAIWEWQYFHIILASMKETKHKPYELLFDKTIYIFMSKLLLKDEPNTTYEYLTSLLNRLKHTQTEVRENLILAKIKSLSKYLKLSILS